MAKESEKFVIICISKLTSLRRCSPAYLVGLTFRSFSNPLLRCLVFLDGSGPGPAKKKSTRTHTYAHINEETNPYNALNSSRWRILDSIPQWSSGERLHTIKGTATLTGGLKCSLMSIVSPAITLCNVSKRFVLLFAATERFS